MVGKTEPRTAQPGTIRADFAHHSYAYTDSKGIAIKNLVHASGKIEEAKYEIELWFKPEELHSYKTGPNRLHNREARAVLLQIKVRPAHNLHLHCQIMWG